MSINSLAIKCNDILRSSPIPRPEAELLLSFLLKKTREYLLTHPETWLTAVQHKQFKILAAKRLAGWPIAYLTGHKEFYDLNFKVSPAVLVPRPETELIVEKIMATAATNAGNHFIDIGTGSGAILISLASEMRRLFPAPYKKSKFSAIDISAAALRVAKQNASRQRLGSKIRFHHGDLLASFKTDPADHRSLIITANLPYLTPSQIRNSPSITREPKLALDGGKDGLKYYRRLFQQIRDLKLSNPLTLLCEIDPSQKKAGSELAKKYFSAAKVGVLKDLSKRDRILEIIVK